MTGIKIKIIQILRYLRIFLQAMGLFFLVMVIVAFTTLPYWGIHWLGTSRSVLKWEPVTIILLGGGGMPSESNLMRCWFAVTAWKSFPGADLVIAMPGNTNDSLSTPALIAGELIKKGVDAGRIRYENMGRNTRAQALECSRLLNIESPVLLVSSPEHMRRAVLTFKKAGFKKINALPAFENATEASLRFEDDSLGGNRMMVPDIGNSISVRYQFWNHLKYEIIFARELMALLYYRVRGWI